MKIFRFSIFVLFFFTISGFANGQSVKENELVVIQGEKFILHQVRTGETVYSISRDFKIESSQLLKNNPNISEGLSIGDILKIPFNENVDLSEIPNYKKGDPTGFINHTIELNGETAYSISKKYGITVEEIYAYNPTVQRLKKGMILKIPQWDFKSKPETTPVEKVQDRASNQVPNQNKMLVHTIVSGETMFGITQKYRVSEEELKAINPELKTGFRTGTVIRIPVNENMAGQVKVKNESKIEAKEAPGEIAIVESTGKIPVGCVPDNSKIATREKTVVALFLPLFLDANDELNKKINVEPTDSLEQFTANNEFAANNVFSTDTIIENEKPVQLFKQFHGNSENFLQFYEGVLIAVDSMRKTGMKIELNVFDTKDNPESVRKVINNEAFPETDLIIGPVYENVQKEVALIAAKNRIPMISPFTPKSAIINNNQQFYQINPTREYIAEATAELIAADYSNTNFIVVQTSSFKGTPEGQLVDLIQKKLAKSGNSGEGKFIEYDFRKERSRGLRNILLADKENVVFIPSSDEGELSVAISNINNLAVDFPITLIGAGNYQQKYPSIEVAHYHNLQLKYINPYWMDYQNPSTLKYLKKFITNFGTEPNSYGVQGFDAAWYFLNALQLYGKGFEDCLPHMNIGLLQGNYFFKRVSPTGGFMNQGVSVISYNRNFEVERKSVIGQPNVKGVD